MTAVSHLLERSDSHSRTRGTPGQAYVGLLPPSVLAQKAGEHRTEANGSDLLRFSGFSPAGPKPLSALGDGAKIKNVVVKATSLRNFALRGLRGKEVKVAVTDAQGNVYRGAMRFWGKFLSSQEDPWNLLGRWGLKKGTYLSDKYIFQDSETGVLHFIDESLIEKILIGGVDRKEEIKAVSTRATVECREQRGPDCMDHALHALAVARKYGPRSNELASFTRDLRHRALEGRGNEAHAQRVHRASSEGGALEPEKMSTEDFVQAILEMERNLLAIYKYRLCGALKPPSHFIVHDRQFMQNLKREFGLESFVTDNVDIAKQALERGHQVLISAPVQFTKASGETIERYAVAENAPEHFNYVRPGLLRSARVERVKDVGLQPLQDLPLRLAPEEIERGNFTGRHAMGGVGYVPAPKANPHAGPMILVTDSNYSVLRDVDSPEGSKKTDRHLPRLFRFEDLRNPPLPTDIPPPPWTVNQILDLTTRLILSRVHFTIFP